MIKYEDVQFSELIERLDNIKKNFSTPSENESAVETEGEISFSDLKKRLDIAKDKISTKDVNFTFAGGVGQKAMGAIPFYGKYNKNRKQKALETILPEYDGEMKSSFKVGDDWSDLYNKLYDYYIEQGVRPRLARKAARRDITAFYRSRIPDFEKFNKMLKTSKDLESTPKLGIVNQKDFIV